MHSTSPTYKELADMLGRQARILIALQASMEAIGEYAADIGCGRDPNLTAAYADKINGIAELGCMALEQLQEEAPSHYSCTVSPLYTVE